MISLPVRIDQDSGNSLQIVDANDHTICQFVDCENDTITPEMKRHSEIIKNLLNEYGIGIGTHKLV